MRILHVEDSAHDAALIARRLRQAWADVAIERVEAPAAFVDAIERGGPWDAVLSDQSMPGFSAVHALALLRERDPDLPFIVVSGVLETRDAVEILKRGGHDFVAKRDLDRLVPALGREIEQAARRRAHRRDQAALAESEARHRATTEHSGAVMLLIDPDSGRIVDANPAAYRFYGHSPGALVGLDASRLGLVPEGAGAGGLAAAHVLLERDHHVAEHRLASGARRTCETLTSAVPVVGRTLAFCIVHDITERRRAERALRTLSECNRAIVHAGDPCALMDAVCQRIVEAGGYALAWVGVARDDAARSVGVAAAHPPDSPYLEGLQESWGEGPSGRGVVGRAIASGATVVAHELAVEPGFEPWRERAVAAGLRCAIALPLHGGGIGRGALAVYSSARDPFTREEIALLEEVAGDLAYGDRALAAQRGRAEAFARLEVEERRLERALAGTVDVLGRTVERRDPYTAGHQRNVASLAAAIARRMGFDERRTHGVELGALVHDVGKIAIPGELLTRPGRLSTAELELIRTHCRAGHDILAPVDMPWPIAEVALQHHERLDGSGYPDGLVGDAILPESRIVAVADVVEAITAHRPYRPGRPLAYALEEIRTHRGLRYDPAVVDACLDAIAERGAWWLDREARPP